MSFSGENRTSARLSPGTFSSRKDGVTEQKSTEWPRITVVVPIRNEERFIAQTLGYILDQDYPADRLEVLVVDGQSTDRTADIVAEIAASDARVKLLSNPRQLSSAARALGASHATGDIITFIDGHVYIENQQLLKDTVLLLEERRVDVLSRPQFLFTPENTPFQDAVAIARRSILGHGLGSTIYESRDGYVDPTSSGAAYRRNVFDTVGNFDDRFDACEDVEFNHRVAKAGFRAFTSMHLAVYYYPRETLKGLFQQMTRYGMGRFRLARKHPDTLSVSTLVPFAFVVGIPLLLVAGIVWHSAWLFAAILVASYLLLTVGGAVVLAAMNGWRYFPMLPGIFGAIHTGLGWGFAVELWRTLRGQSVRFDR